MVGGWMGSGMRRHDVPDIRELTSFRDDHERGADNTTQGTADVLGLRVIRAVYLSYLSTVDPSPD